MPATAESARVARGLRRRRAPSWFWMPRVAPEPPPRRRDDRRRDHVRRLVEDDLEVSSCAGRAEVPACSRRATNLRFGAAPSVWYVIVPRGRDQVVPVAGDHAVRRARFGRQVLVNVVARSVELQEPVRADVHGRVVRPVEVEREPDRHARSRRRRPPGRRPAPSASGCRTPPPVFSA